MNGKGMFDGALGKYLLPGIILQSVLIGGGYATGREIVEYGGKFGALGWWSGVATFIGFAIVSALSFELIRMYKLYDFKSFIRSIAGPLYRVFDVVYTIFMIIVIAIMSSATGSIVEEMTGLNYWVGVIGITIVVGILNFYGANIISYFETFGTIALYVGYICFSVLVISSHTGNIERVFAAQDISYTPDATVPLALWTGILYIAYNLIVFPASFFSIRRQESRKQSMISGVIAGLLMTLPWFLTYFAIMGFYPSAEINGAPVPWVMMMTASGAPGWMMVMFGIVMGWTLIETATGVIHAMIERIEKGREESGKIPLTRAKKAAITVGILIVSIAFSKFGIIALVAKAYTILAYMFILLFLVPLLTVGVYKIFFKKVEDKETVPQAVVNK